MKIAVVTTIYRYLSHAQHMVDRFLQDKGWLRRVALDLSHFMSLLAILPRSDFIATVPDDIASAVERHIPIKRLTLPFQPPVIEVQQFWHRRMQHDPANQWLRGVFYAVNRRAAAGPGNQPDSPIGTNTP